jgi:cytochrome b561
MTSVSKSAEESAKKPAAENGRFDRISIALHWLTVLLITGQLTTAWLREAVGHESSLAMERLATHRANGLSDLDRRVAASRLAAQFRLFAAISARHVQAATNDRKGQ